MGLAEPPDLTYSGTGEPRAGSLADSTTSHTAATARAKPSVILMMAESKW